MWNICRTCMSKEVEMISIYDEHKSPSISAMIMTISSLEFLPNDTLPSQICVTCFGTLQMTYNFKEQVIRCNNVLQTQSSKQFASNQMFSLKQVKEEDDTGRYHLDGESSTNVANHASMCSDPLMSTDNDSTYDPLSEYDVKLLNYQFPVTDEARYDILSDGRSSEDNIYVPSHFEETYIKSEEVEVEEHCEQFEDDYKITSNQFTPKNNADTSSEDDVPLTELQENTDNSTKSEDVQQNSNEISEDARQLSQSDKSYKCIHCNKQYKREATLRNHLYEHKNPHKCEICEKVFPWASLLEIHMRKHSGERPFKCQQCSATFSQSSNLQQHIRTHKGEEATRLKCEVCGKTFTRLPSLKIHMRGHTGERPFKCQHCDSSFTRKGILKNHLRTHSDEGRPKPHKCEVCGKAFEAPHQVKIHKRSHSNERPFKCQHCNATFKHDKHLKFHCRKHIGKVKNN